MALLFVGGEEDDGFAFGELVVGVGFEGVIAVAAPDGEDAAGLDGGGDMGERDLVFGELVGDAVLELVEYVADLAVGLEEADDEGGVERTRPRLPTTMR